MRYNNKWINELLDENYITQNEYNILFDTAEYKKGFLEALNKVLFLFKEEEHLHLNEISFPNLPQVSNFYSYIVSVIGTRCSNNLREIGFWHCNFYSEIYIHEITIKHHLHFGKATFLKKVNFNKSTFEKRIDFLNTTFKDNITFGGVKFQDEAHFWNSDAYKLISFNSITCSKIFSINDLAFNLISMDNAQFKEVNFIGLVGLDNQYVTLNKTHFTTRETTTILRTNLEKGNHISESNKYFQIGQELYIDYLKKRITEPNRRATLGVVYLNKFVSNFGTDWVRPLLMILIFSFFTSLGYGFLQKGNENIDFTNSKLLLFYGLLYATWIYYTYNKKLWIIWVASIIVLFSFIMSYTHLKELSNDISKLINPLNIFKPKANYFENIAMYGMLVKLGMSVLIYQFIMAFRQNTRRK